MPENKPFDIKQILFVLDARLRKLALDLTGEFEIFGYPGKIEIEGIAQGDYINRMASYIDIRLVCSPDIKSKKNIK